MKVGKKVTKASIKALKNNDGLTIKNGKRVNYATGWQVATEGVECLTPEDTMEAIKKFGGNCGIWFSDKIYYVDKSQRVSTKKEGMQIGRECNQQTILNWKTMECVVVE